MQPVNCRGERHRRISHQPREGTSEGRAAAADLIEERVEELDVWERPSQQAHVRARK